MTNPQPKVIVTNDKGLHFARNVINNLKPSSFVIHFDDKATIILMKRKAGARKYLTIGKIIIPRQLEKYSLLFDKIDKLLCARSTE